MIKILSPSEVLSQFKKLTFFRSSHQMSHVKNVIEILSKFNENDIRAIVLKGLVVRKFYPRLEFRTMSDADIVVQESEFDAAINLIISLGYVERAVRIVFYICSECLVMKLKAEMDNGKYIDEKYLSMLLSDIMNHGVFP